MASIDKIEVGDTSYTIEAENAIPFVVQISEGDTGMYADRTAVEIAEAFRGGKNIYAVLAGVILPLVGVLDDMAVFVLNVGSEIGQVFIDFNGNVDFISVVPVLEETLPDVINSALEQAKASGEFDGKDGSTGQRGVGLLAITTAPSAYTTAVNGLTPAYRIALSTVRTQASVTEVFAGDTLRYSYYHYPVIYVDSSYVYCRARVSIRGATGAAGTNGADGATGPAGPNTVSTSTSSNISGLLKGNGSNVVAATAGADYAVPSAARTASLSVDGWNDSTLTQTVSVAGVTANNNIIVTPAPDSCVAWGAAGIYCSAQASGTLTFKCTAKPSAAITANIMIVG